MKKNKRPQKKRSRNKQLALKIGGIVGGVAIVGFLVWLGIRVLTADTNMEVVQTYKLPDFASLDNLPELGYGALAVAIDGEIVGSHDGTEVRPTASTAKMILGLAVMEKKPFKLGEKGETLTIDRAMYDRYIYYANNNGSLSKVVLGEEISEYDALAEVFLVSSNNMADSLAIWAFGSLDEYRAYASEMLSRWGIEDTEIGIDASGFDESTVSTAESLAKIGEKVLENEVLREIVGMKEYTTSVAGVLENTNKILGANRIIGVKTGYIGDTSGYCLVSGYLEGEHIVTIALLGAPTRSGSFNDSLEAAVSTQNTIREQVIIHAGETVGHYNSWWTGPVKIQAKEDLRAVGWAGADEEIELEMFSVDGGGEQDDSGNEREAGEMSREGVLKVRIGGEEYTVAVEAEEFEATPSFGERLSHSFGWKKDGSLDETDSDKPESEEGESYEVEQIEEETSGDAGGNTSSSPEQSGPITKAATDNCTVKYGYLMLINPNFVVDTNFIDARRSELVSISSLYGIVEGNAYNGDNLLDAEAASHLNDMVKAYEAEYPGHTFETRSCYRARGTTCGRLCAATGTSDHHTGLTCDLLDPVYGTSLDTDTYNQHIDWQWLKANSYKYGFIDRFPEAWAGGSMSEPLNVDANGTTGLYETWHYRYVGIGPATDIATGKYNNGAYDSLEHYLKARGMVTDLKGGRC